MVVIRLARGGRVHKPVYTVVAADSRSPRDGRFLERLGKYDPNMADGENLIGLKTKEMKAWLDKGAVPSDTVRSLLKKNKVSLS